MKGKITGDTHLPSKVLTDFFLFWLIPTNGGIIFSKDDFPLSDAFRLK